VSELCGHDHGRGGGHLDERARRLSHPEFAVAEQLAAEGHQVRSLAERRGQGRTPDLLVCGVPVEVKSWLSRQERGGRPPSVPSVVNKLLQAEGQAASVVLNGRGSGLDAATATAGLAAYSDLPHRGNVAAVRVFGDGFDLAWAAPGRLERDRARDRARDRTQDRLPARSVLGLGL
jgi:hypothetical protein